MSHLSKKKDLFSQRNSLKKYYFDFDAFGSRGGFQPIG